MRYALALPLLVLPLLGLLLAPARAGEPGVPAAKAAASSASVNRFSVDLYRAVGQGDDNVFFSPYSVHAALGMTREGADGDTAKQLDAVFHFPKALGASQRALKTALQPGMAQEWRGRERVPVRAYDLNIANALWGQVGFEFLPAFTSALEGHNAPLARIDFRQQVAARKAINDWVAQQTRDKIQDIVPPGLPTADTRLALANAIYFKASWASPFFGRNTKSAPWTRLDGSEGNAELMRRVAGFGYTEDADVQVAELSYRGRETSMVVVLPRKKAGLLAIERTLTHEKLAAWIAALRAQRVDLHLPKWKFTTSLDLTSTLAEMGMPLAFDASQADFSRMTKAERLFIGVVLHKAFVAVDEAGTEAAAATVVAMRGAAAAPSRPKSFVADHPFLFLIRHRKTGAILFMGRVTDPAAE